MTPSCEKYFTPQPISSEDVYKRQPYTGSGPLSSALAMDKAVAKRVMDSYGIRTAPWREVVYGEDDIPGLLDTLPLPRCV